LQMYDKDMYCADGFLWDESSVASAIIGMQEENSLNDSCIISIYYDHMSLQKLWNDHSNTEATTLNATYPMFSGKMPSPKKFKVGQDTLYVFQSCRLLYPSFISELLVKNATVHFVVVQFYFPDFNHFPFQKATLWKLVDLSLKTRIEKIFNIQMFRETLSTRKFAVCFAGGGCKSAMLTSNVLNYLQSKKNEMKVISATSGGAWGVILHYLHNDDNRIVIDHMIANVNELTNIREKLDTWLLFFFRRIDSTRNLETLVYLLPLVKKLDFDWQKVVQMVIKGNSDTDLHWKIIPPKLRVIMTTTVLYNV
jgi:hypothetical protein